MNQRTYLFEDLYVSYVGNVSLGTINLSASYRTFIVSLYVSDLVNA